MAKEVKNCQLKTIGRSAENLSFITSLSEITGFHPLAYISSSDDVISLTPNCFLKPHFRTRMVIRKKDTSDLVTMSQSSSRNTLIKALQKSSDKFKEFKTRWYEEYPLSLQETYRDLYQTRCDNLDKVNDVVLICTPIKERPF